MPCSRIYCVGTLTQTHNRAYRELTQLNSAVWCVFARGFSYNIDQTLAIRTEPAISIQTICGRKHHLTGCIRHLTPESFLASCTMCLHSACSRVSVYLVITWRTVLIAVPRSNLFTPLSISIAMHQSQSFNRNHISTPLHHHCPFHVSIQCPIHFQYLKIAF